MNLPDDKTVEALAARIDRKPTKRKRTVRAQAVAMFEAELDARLANLQPGETLQILFRVDIINAKGKVRQGRFSQRNMEEYRQWRTAVFERDSYLCRDCGKGGDITAHHVKEWAKHPELRFDVDNGRTLCRDCHAEKHPHLRRLFNGQAD